ncbi:MAG TPA: outer membrane protein assembly factor BamD [Aequorivita sp.]|nr:outer membrane protein assembly factor BamD [Aequorivita sp.]
MFLKPMRLPVFIIFCVTILFTSCGQYQKVLRKDDLGKKYTFADSLYQNGKYKKALKLMEQLVPVYRGKPQGEKLMYIYADTYFQIGDFFSSGYQFERFAQAYPQSDSTEVAFFKSAKSFYELSERYSLDQRETYRGLNKLQDFINTYPNSERREEANTLVIELRTKLEKKEFEVAKQYYHIEAYKAAIEAFDNFITDNPGTVFREEAFLFKTKAAYKLAINSIPSLVEERLLAAKRYYNNYQKYYKQGSLAEEANEISQEIDKRLATLESKPI